MPPKKKVRLPSRAASTPPGDAFEQAEKEIPTPMKEGLGMATVVSDAWTDEQETSLFKSMIRWKPSLGGMHKHFRMISISENLKNHGYSSPQNAHTRIPGIWQKLGSLYNLETLDAREDAFGEPVQMDGDPAKQPFCAFTLPEDEYLDMMFARRLAPEGTSSPPLLSHQLSGMSLEGGRAARRYSTVDDTDDPRSSPASIGGPRRGRNTRASKGTRTSLLAEVSTVGGRQGGKGSVDQGTDDGQKDEEEGGEAMAENEDDSKAAMLKDTSKASKGTASKNSAKRRSGRKRFASHCTTRFASALGSNSSRAQSGLQNGSAFKDNVILDTVRNNFYNPFFCSSLTPADWEISSVYIPLLSGSGMLQALARSRSALRNSSTNALKVAFQMAQINKLQQALMKCSDFYHGPSEFEPEHVCATRRYSVFPLVRALRPDIPSLTDCVSGYREDSSKGAMLRFEDSLPRLPVPTLEETSKRYLKSVHPLLNKAEFAATKRIVDEFVKPGSIGQELQKRLQARREDPKHRNWIYEWWNDAAYLSYRDPVVPYVSYFYSHRDDRRRRNPAKRAAALTTAVLEFKKQVDSGTLEPEYMKRLPISMESYQWMFNACRIPGKSVDYPVKYSHEDHKYFTVVRKNQFFKVMYEISGQQLNAAELETQFNRIYKMAQKTPAVGALTSQNRDVWYTARETLRSAHPANAAALETIQASGFLVCLDDASPVTLEERAHQYWHGDGANRWFDKPLEFIVNENGTSGFNGEHSMMDGTPTHRLNDYINMMVLTNKLDLSDSNVRSDLAEPVAVKLHINEAVNKEIHRAISHHENLIAQHELRVQAYQGYGKGLIKKFKCSPDAYVQMIIQLAYHKMYGTCRPTYESAATRRFQQGRTETCRSVSDESVAFCAAMADPEVPPEECIKALRAAVDAHVKYITDASDGKGVDRHLFGLKKCLKEGEELPEIFKDRAYSYSGTWYLSTSQLSSEFFNGYGWSQVIDDGFGIAYMINENSIQFNIVSKGLGSERMSFWLNEAAGDIRDLLLPTIEGPKAKL